MIGPFASWLVVVLLGVSVTVLVLGLRDWGRE